MGRGELVALLDAAPGDLRTLTGTLRRWTHHGRMRTAFERANDALVRQRRGRAVRVGGRWLIERGTIAELLASAGVHVPPPP